MQLDLKQIEPVELRTERLLLRPVQEGDRDEYIKFEAENRTFFSRYAPPPPGVEEGAAMFERLLKRTHEGLALGNAVRLVLFVENEMAGGISIGDVVRGQAQRANVGYHVGERFGGQGLATEALRAVSEFGLSPAGLGLHRLEVSVQPENLASLAVAKKAGYVQEGFFEKFLFIGGAWRDHIILARRAD